MKIRVKLTRPNPGTGREEERYETVDADSVCEGYVKARHVRNASEMWSAVSHEVLDDAGRNAG